MKPSQFYIVLDNESRTFSSGQTIRGTVIFDNDKPRDIINISLTIEAGAKVCWTERSGKQYKTYTDNEVYFDHKIQFYENETFKAIKLPIGVFSYPFQFPLPSNLNLPSNFNGEYGRVEYNIASELYLSAIFKSNPIAKLCFNVNGVVDLNLDQRLREKFQYEREFLKGFFRSQPVSCKIVLPKTGFVCGEWIDFSAEFVNRSDCTLESVEVSLMRASKYHVGWKSNFFTETICSKLLECSIKSGERMEWGKNVMQIPSVPPTGLGGCEIMHIKYYLQFRIHMSGFLVGSTFKQRVNIAIGTVPLTNSGERGQASQHMGGGLGEATLSDPTPEPELALSLSLSPPSYDEAMKLVPATAQN